MPGVKGKGGGAGRGQGRHAKPDNPNSTLAVSAQARQELRILTLNHRAGRNNPKLTQREVLEELIYAAWLAYDAQIEVATDKVLEGEVQP